MSAQVRGGAWAARPLGRVSLARPWTMAVLVFLAAFSLYALSTSQVLEGYEAETAAVTEGFVKTGDWVLIPGSPLKTEGQGFGGADGHFIGRAGLTEPLIRVPFYVAGWAVDEIDSDSSSWKWRERAFWFASPFFVAVGVAFFFLLVLELTGSRRWGLVMAGLFAVAGQAWPYSKIGMEGVLMTAFVITVYGVVRASRSDRLWPWVLTGFGAGAALADKPYGLFAVAAVLAYLIPVVRAMSGAERLRRIAAIGVPMLLWGVGFGLYNQNRTGSFFDTGRNDPETTLAAPINFIGFFVSPGKGLIFFSPLVVIGAIGLAAMYRRNRRLTLSIVAALVGGIAIVAVLRFWSDETWGPRYIVWVAWLLLLPIPFWAVTRRRRQVLAGVATLAVTVQFLGVIAPSTMITNVGPDLTGYPLFQRVHGQPIPVPYGRDPIRWVPELSPLLLQAKVVLSKASMAVGGPPITTVYHPYEGRTRKVTFDQQQLSQDGFGVVYLWWAQGGMGKFGTLGVAFLLLVGGASTALLVAEGRRPDGPRPG